MAHSKETREEAADNAVHLAQAFGDPRHRSDVYVRATMATPASGRACPARIRLSLTLVSEARRLRTGCALQNKNNGSDTSKTPTPSRLAR